MATLEEATVRVSADARYTLYVNGQRVPVVGRVAARRVIAHYVAVPETPSPAS
jgi:hypothetical protein